MTTLRGGTTTISDRAVCAGQGHGMAVPRPQTGRNRVSAGHRPAYHRTKVAYHPSDLRKRQVVRLRRTKSPKPQVSASYHRTYLREGRLGTARPSRRRSRARAPPWRAIACHHHDHEQENDMTTLNEEFLA